MQDLKEPKHIRESIRQWILQKWLDRLEPRPTDPDIVSLVLTSLRDSDIGLLAELASLSEAGFDEGQTAQMMGSRHKSAMEAVATFQKDMPPLWRLVSRNQEHRRSRENHTPGRHRRSMAAEKSPTVTLADLARRQKNLKRKIGRAEESGDIVRLLSYRLQLERMEKT